MGLDSSGFTQGQKDAIAKLKNMEDQSKKTGDSLTKAGKTAADAFSSLKRELLAVAALFVGLSALKSFVTDTISSAAAVDRLSTVLGMNTKDLVEWQLAAKMAGGSVASINSVLGKSSKLFADYRMGKDNAELGAMRNYATNTGVNIDQSHIINSDTLLKAQSDIVKALYDKEYANNKNSGKSDADAKYLSTATAANAAREMGWTDDLFNLIKDGSVQLQKNLDANEALAKSTADLAPDAEKLRQNFVKLQQEFENVGTKILTKLMPYFEEFGNWLTGPEFQGKLKEFTDWFSSDEFHDAITSVTDAFVLLAGAIGDLLDFLPTKKNAKKGTEEFLKGNWDSASNTMPALDFINAVTNKMTGGLLGKSAESILAGQNGSSNLSQSRSGKIGGPVSSDDSKVRNVRNNNPGNIKYGNYAISKGAIGADGDFAVFKDAAAGTAAMTDLLKQKKASGLNTIEKLIAGSAGKLGWLGGGTDLKAASDYIADVSKQTGLNKDAALTDDQLVRVRQAMMIHEGMSKANAAAIGGLPELASSARTGSGVTNTVGDTNSSETVIHNVIINANTNDPAGLASAFGNRVKGLAGAVPNSTTGVAT